MAASSTVGDAIAEMVRFFLPYCREQSTLLELLQMASDPVRWRHGHALFRRIRDKTLKADNATAKLFQSQYAFEEICAKTLFNLSDHYDPGYKEFPPPFDEDSPFWVLPIAVGFARALGVDDPCRVSTLLRPDSR
jgi:hypothetical protein